VKRFLLNVIGATFFVTLGATVALAAESAMKVCN
jgi:hypothetical protein